MYFIKKNFGVVFIVLIILCIRPLSFPNCSSVLKNEVYPKYKENYKNNNAFIPGAKKCTNEQREKITKKFGFKEDEFFDSKNFKHYGILRVKMGFKWSQCVDATWIKKYYEDSLFLDRFVGISVGCNKGFDAIETARMGFNNQRFNSSSWKNSTLFELLAGACKQDKQEDILLKNSKIRYGEMHCIEPMPATFAKLQKASESLNLKDQGLILSNIAISTVDSVIQFPSISSQSGIETFGIDSCMSNKVRRKSLCKNVTVYSLDSYVEKFVQSSGPIHILQVDVEGWDFNVLFGGGSALDRTHYLEFEYHNKGMWENLILTDAIRLLDAKGFTCYFAGKGDLLRLTECYFEIYKHWHGWSNIACAHRSQSDLANRMESLFLENLK